jgi:hypothetical protein
MKKLFFAIFCYTFQPNYLYSMYHTRCRQGITDNTLKLAILQKNYSYLQKKIPFLNQEQRRHISNASDPLVRKILTEPGSHFDKKE